MTWIYNGIIYLLDANLLTVNIAVPWMSKVVLAKSLDFGIDIVSVGEADKKPVCCFSTNAPRRECYPYL